MVGADRNRRVVRCTRGSKNAWPPCVGSRFEPTGAAGQRAGAPAAAGPTCAPQIFDLTRNQPFEHVYLFAMLNLPQLVKFFRTSLRVLLDVLTVFRTGLRSRGALAAENLFLRKQLALYLERKKRPRRATDAVRYCMRFLRCCYGRFPPGLCVHRYGKLAPAASSISM
jgi:hypothetical protein